MSKLISVLFLILLSEAFVPAAQAAPPKLSGGFEIQLLDPYPVLLGIGMQAKFFDAISLTGFFDPFKFAVLGFGGNSVLTYGGIARLRWPGLKYSPSVGLAWVKTSVTAPVTFMGMSLTNATNYIVTIGMQMKISHKVHVGLDYMITYVDRPGQSWGMSAAFIPIGAYVQLSY